MRLAKVLLLATTRLKHAYWMPLVEAETQRLKNLNGLLIENGGRP